MRISATGADFLADIQEYAMQGLQYHYVIKDHLGSPRIVFNDKNNNGTVDAGEVEDVKNFYLFGLEWDETPTDQVDQYRRSFTDQERVSHTNILEFQYRCLLKGAGVWDGPDPLSSEYPAIATGVYVANNPILLVDPNGAYIDLSNLSESQRKNYNDYVAELRRSKLFDEYYNRLLSSETTYVIKAGSGYGGSGSFNPNTNEIHAMSMEALAQELFHAYQSDLEVYDKKDLSVQETEGDLLSTNVLLSLGHITMAHEWDQGIGYEYVDNDFVFDERVLSKDFDKDFNKAVNERITFYKRRELNDGAKAPKSYLQKNSGVGAKALKKLIREVRANNLLVGPRLRNGDYYQN